MVKYLLLKNEYLFIFTGLGYVYINFFTQIHFLFVITATTEKKRQYE